MSDESADDDADLARFRERLRDRLESLARPGDRKHGLVDVVADDLSRRLWDEHSKVRYCVTLWNVTKGVTLPGEVLEAFDGASAGFAGGTVGVAGSYFFGAIDNMRSDRAHDELEMELRAERV